MQFNMLQSWITTAFELSFWALRLPQAIYAVMFTKYYESYCSDGYTPSYVDDWILGMCFVFACTIVESVVSTPFGLFSTFMIEETHGFNKQTLGGWFKDQVKVALLMLFLLPAIYYMILWIIASTGEYFILYLGIAMTILVLFFVVAAPTCLMPLFNKFEKIQKNLLRRDIYRLAKDVDYPLSKIEVIDGSTRSSHSNAF